MADATHDSETAFPDGAARRFAVAYAGLFLPFSVATPLLQKLLHLRGLDRAAVGATLGTLEVMAVVAPPVWGILSDRTGRPKRLLLVAAAVSAPLFLLFGAVGTLAGGVATAAVFGFFYRPLIPLTDGYTFRFIHHRGGEYGPVRACGSISFISLLVCLDLLQRFGVVDGGNGTYILVAFVAASVFHITTIIALPQVERLDRTTAPPPRIDLRVFARRSFVFFTLAAFLGRMAMMSYYGFFTLYLEEHIGCDAPELVWTLGPLSEIPVIWFSARIMRRTGVRTLFALGLLGIAVRLVGFGMVETTAQVLPLQILHALTFGAYHCASVTFVSRVVPPHMKASAQTVFAGLTMGLGGICGGVLGGIVAKNAGYPALYSSFGLIALAGLLVLVVAVPPEKDAAESHSDRT